MSDRTIYDPKTHDRMARRLLAEMIDIWRSRDIDPGSLEIAKRVDRWLVDARKCLATPPVL